MSTYSCPEPLESRIAPASIINPSTVSHRDIDGDNVTITCSEPIFTAATVNSLLKFSTGNVDGSTTQKQALWEINFDAVSGPSAAPVALDLTVEADGAGKANVGFIRAETIDLGKVTIDGDLGRILVGDGTTSTRGMIALSVDSIGLFALKTQAPGGDLVSIFHGGIETIDVKKSVNKATLLALGNETEIDGNLDGSFGKITIGGALAGGSTSYSGAIVATGPIESVEIHGNLIGDAGNHSGFIGFAQGEIIGVPDLFAAGGPVGSVKIGGMIRASTGSDSGSIQTESVESISVGGDVLGAKGTRTGFLYAVGGMGLVEIGGDLKGGDGLGSGRVENNDGGLGKVFIGGNVLGGKGSNSGTVYSDSNLGFVFIDGNVTGGAGNIAGSVGAQGSLDLVNVGGNVTSSTGKNSGRISADKLLGTVHISGNVKGSAAHPVWITGGGIAGDAHPAIDYVSVGGYADYTNFGAGFSKEALVADNPDAILHEISVMGKWRGSNALAGVVAGADGKFGTSDDALASGTNDSSLLATIERITIGGTIVKTPLNSDHFGIVAQLIGQVTVGGQSLPLQDGPFNDVINPPSTNDLTVREIGAIVRGS